MSVTYLHCEASDNIHGGGCSATIEVRREGLVFEETVQVRGSELVGLAVGEENEDKSGFVVGGELTTEMEFQLLIFGLEHLIERVLVFLEDLKIEELAVRAVIAVFLDGIEKL
jgi:hypothetical protein